MAIAAAPRGGSDVFIRQRKAAPREEDIRRAQEFRRAKRHSVLVRVLKVLLPAIAAGILSLYALPYLLRVPAGKNATASVRTVTLEAGSLKMLEPRVKGVTDKNDAYEFLADSATQASRKAEVMYLANIRGHLSGHDGKVTTLTAPDGVHNNKAEEMTFDNGAFVKQDGGLSAQFQTATAFMKQQMLISKTPVTVRLQESTIHSDSMTMFWGEQRAIFEGNVRTHIERQPSGAESLQPATEPPAANSWSAQPAGAQ